MKLETAKSWAPRLLLGFVLISIGFAFGKAAGLRTAQRAAPVAGPGSPAASIASPQPAGTDKVLVYYMHGTIRCVTCNEIENTARQIVQTQFADDVAAGHVEWQELNFERDPALAKKYDVASSTVVVVQFRNGRETAHKRLDDVWTLIDKPDEFRRYITAAVQALMKENAP